MPDFVNAGWGRYFGSVLLSDFPLAFQPKDVVWTQRFSLGALWRGLWPIKFLGSFEAVYLAIRQICIAIFAPPSTTSINFVNTIPILKPIMPILKPTSKSDSAEFEGEEEKEGGGEEEEWGSGRGEEGGSGRGSGGEVVDDNIFEKFVLSPSCIEV